MNENIRPKKSIHSTHLTKNYQKYFIFVFRVCLIQPLFMHEVLLINYNRPFVMYGETSEFTKKLFYLYLVFLDFSNAKKNFVRNFVQVILDALH